jgi:plasmid stabilization system protein ParE
MAVGGKRSTGDNADQPADNIIRFEHKFFSSFEDLYFRLTDTGEAVAVIKLANNDAILSFEGMRREFMFKEDAPDGQMLVKVAAGLAFVRGLRPGDELPKELTTREASWQPADKHLMVARQRLTMQLVTWMTGEEHIFTTVEELLQMAQNPDVRKNINLAFAEAAEELGLGRDRREEVVGYIEKLAHELAYIEFERDVMLDVRRIDDKIQGLRRLYSVDRSLMDTADQVARLSQRAVKLFQDNFDQVDAQTGEIMAMLKNIDNQMEYIRTVRDELHQRLLPWEDFIRIWKSIYVVRSDENTARLRDIYQFLAPRFMQVNEWVLITKRGFEKAKPIGGVLRW